MDNFPNPEEIKTLSSAIDILRREGHRKDFYDSEQIKDFWLADYHIVGALKAIEAKEVEAAVTSIQSALKPVVEAWQQFIDALSEAVRVLMAEIQKIAIELSRFFLRQQLLEWRVSAKWADFIAKNLYWKWSVSIGFRWFQKRFIMPE